MERTIQRLLILFLVLPVAGNALAGGDSGFYLGGSIAQAQVDYRASEPGIGEIDLDDDDSGYKVFAGYNFGLVPFLDIAVEGAYADLGNLRGEAGGTTMHLETDAWTLAGLVGVNLGPLGVFAKVGLIEWDADLRTELGSASDSGNDPIYGIGARIQLGSIALRAEYEWFELEDDLDFDYFSVGAAFTF